MITFELSVLHDLRLVSHHCCKWRASTIDHSHQSNSVLVDYDANCLQYHLWVCDYIHTLKLTALASLWWLSPGLRSRSRDQSWSRSESIVLDWVGSWGGKIWPTPIPAGSRSLTPNNRRWFWTSGYAPFRKHWKTGRKGERLCVNDVKCRWVIWFRLIKGIGDSFSAITIVLWLWQ